MSSADSKSPREEIFSSLESLVRVSEQCSLRLRKRLSRVRFARSLLTGLLLFVGFSTVAVAIIVTKFSSSFIAQNRTLVLIIFGLFILIGFATGVVSYVMLGKKQDTNLSKLSSLIDELKKEGNSNPAPIANILLIMENIFSCST
jgi:ABC-type transporter Mla maintaining outer membrane lipid asymmetry permease subunit MlaE